MNVSNDIGTAQRSLDRIHDATEAKVTLERIFDAHKYFIETLKKQARTPPEFGRMTFGKKGEIKIACLDKNLRFDSRPIASQGCVYAMEYSASTHIRDKEVTIFQFYLDEHGSLWADPLHEDALWRTDSPYLLTNILAFTSRALLDSMVFSPG